MITQEEAEQAVHDIIENAPEMGKSKARKEYLEQYRKTKKAQLVQKATGTVQERESYAYAHPDYIQLLKDLETATENFERQNWIMRAWQITVDAWRTQESSRRISI